MKDSSDT